MPVEVRFWTYTLIFLPIKERPIDILNCFFLQRKKKANIATESSQFNLTKYRENDTDLKAIYRRNLWIITKERQCSQEKAETQYNRHFNKIAKSKTSGIISSACTPLFATQNCELSPLSLQIHFKAQIRRK